MALTADDLIEKAIDQRNRKRYDEALVSGLAAVELEPDNANTWWQVALAHWMLSDHKKNLPVLRKVVELAPGFANGWSRLGQVLEELDNNREALTAFERALSEDADHEGALRGLARLYPELEDARTDAEELHVLERLEALHGLSNWHTNRIGVLYYQSGNNFDAIKYWQRCAFENQSSAGLYNLGLAYSRADVAQATDAIDAWRLCHSKFPDHDESQKKILAHLPRSIAQATRVREIPASLLPKDQWHSFYMNPFELLDSGLALDYEDYDTKTIQKQKKALLQEIELEDGHVSWLPGVLVDKSKAISLCDELHDEERRLFHWMVFEHKPLLTYLTRGSLEHFLVSPDDSPLYLIEQVHDEDLGFRAWLSEPFAKQFDVLLPKALELGNPTLLEALLAGRRWVTPAHSDQCFESARRLIDRRLDYLRQAKDRAVEHKPALLNIRDCLSHKSLSDILNRLPAYFRDFQDETVGLLRSIALSSYNKHSDSALAKGVLELALTLTSASGAMKKLLAEDIETIDGLIAKETEKDVRLTKADEDWIITKDGTIKGDIHIPTEDVLSLRWGSLRTRNQSGLYTDFIVALRGKGNKEIHYNWIATSNIESNEQFFSRIIDGLLAYVFPGLAMRIDAHLEGGSAIQIGPVIVTQHSVRYDTKGLFFNSNIEVPWALVGCDITNGDMSIFDVNAPKKRTTFSFRDTYNAPVLRYLAQARSPNCQD